MKRYLIILLLSLSCAFVLCGCSGLSGTGDDSQNEQTDSNTSDTTSPAADPDLNSAGSEVSIPTFEPVVLLENENCRVTVQSIDPDYSRGYAVKLLLENHTDNTTMFTIDLASVNSVMLDPYWAAKVEADSTLESDVVWSTLDMKRAGITDVTSISMDVSVYNTTDYSNVLLKGSGTVYPFGESSAASASRTPGEKDIELTDNENCRVIATSIEEIAGGGYTLCLYLVNKTDSTLMFSMSDTALNDQPATLYRADLVSPGCTCYTALHWTKEDLKGLSIDKLTTVDLALKVIDYDDWYAEDYLDEEYSLNAEHFLK